MQLDQLREAGWSPHRRSVEEDCRTGAVAVGVERHRLAQMVRELEVGCGFTDRQAGVELAGRDHPLGAGDRERPP